MLLGESKTGLRPEISSAVRERIGEGGRGRGRRGGGRAIDAPRQSGGGEER